MAVVSFEVVTFHARGAWPYRDGEMTHSADGTATLASGEIVSFTTSRYHVPSAPRGERVSYSIGLYSAARRELKAAKWDALKAAIRKHFVAHVRRMADGPRATCIHPAKEAALVAEYVAAAAESGDAFHISNAAEHAACLADGGLFDADATRAGIAALAAPVGGFEVVAADVPADVAALADAKAACAVLAWPGNAVAFASDALALRAWIDSSGPTPAFYCRPVADMPLTRCALPPSKALAETWAAR